MPGTDGNNEQIRIVAQSVAESTAAETLKKFVEMHPELGTPRKAELPASLKLWGTVGASLLTASIIGVGFWGVTTLSAVQTTLARMDERQLLLGPIQEKRFADLENSRIAMESRVTVLEQRKGKP